MIMTTYLIYEHNFLDTKSNVFSSASLIFFCLSPTVTYTPSMGPRRIALFNSSLTSVSTDKSPEITTTSIPNCCQDLKKRLTYYNDYPRDTKRTKSG